MILVELIIQDYKQFAGEHRFTPTPEGVIAVIGQNGAGKTTLFEAIEWCLYQPREIALDEVAPRGLVSKTRVQLSLLNPDSGITYVIVRSLSKSRVADAEIYREDDPDNRIVKGSRQATDYVARTLIGLSHRAFVSTFFTRQKELTFFGDLKETERRREVGRLLGMETIRDAQKLIAEERNDAQTQAKLYEIQSAEAAEGRDFAAETDDAAASAARAADQVAAATGSLEAAEISLSAARAEVERIAAAEREHARLTALLERVDGDIRARQTGRESALAELARMQTAAAERDALARLAAATDERRAKNEQFDAARERHLQVQRLHKELERAGAAFASAAGDLRATVANAGVRGVPGWEWTKADVQDPAAAAVRVIAIAAGVDLDLADARASALQTADKLWQDLLHARSQVETFRAFKEKLTKERDESLAAGDPHALRDAAMRARETALRAVDHASARLPAIADETERLEPVLARLLAQQDGAICPTCGRPIEANDIAVTEGLFRARLDELADERIALSASRDAAASAAAGAEREISAQTERVSQHDKLQERIANGEQRIAETELGAAQIEATLAEHQHAHELSGRPTADQLDAAKQQLDIARRFANAAPLLRRLQTGLSQSADEIRAWETELIAAGEVGYDPAAHDAAKIALKEAETAVARIGQIDRLLAGRAEREAEIAAADLEIGRLNGERGALHTERAAIGFSPDQLSTVRATERVAIAAERAARDERAQAIARDVDAKKRVAALIEEQARIKQLIERADRRTREAGELDVMYREFNGFEQFVAERLTPQLADYTAELLGAITEEKYDGVVFTSNYGIRVFDGAEEHFPVEEFSGGERDVIALCARLALSRLIGGQASNPPGFMVLDEVFGSLDRERRAQVLETLGALAGTSDAFKQLFIISHVDDVRSSPIFNEVWRVAEATDGVSQLENLNLTGGFEDA